MGERGDSIHQGRQLLFQRSKKRAFDCLYKSEYNRAYAHFLVAIHIEPDDEEMLNLLLYTLSMLSNALESQENWQELLMCYQQTLEVLPNSAQVLHGLATVLFRLGHIQSAIDYFQRAFRENPFYIPSLYCADNIKNSLVERWHFSMLNDKERNTAFAQAINRAVKNGYRRVLDIGAGTGIFSMMAIDAGAEKVYACEGSQVMFGLMQSIVEANKKDVVLLNKMSYNLNIPSDLPERVNLVVTETFDAGLFGEHILQTLSHAWDHLLKRNESIGASEECPLPDTAGSTMPESRVIPQSASLWAVPIECQAVRKDSIANSKSLNALGLFDVEVASSSCYEEPYSTERLADVEGGYIPLCTPQKIASINFNNVQEIKSYLNGKLLSTTCICTTKGRIDAVAIWFDLNLDEEISLSTEPGITDSCWEQAIFYVLPENFQGTSIFVNSGDSLTLDFMCKGHLTLQKVTSSVDAESVKFVTVQPPVIQTLNLLSSTGVLQLNLLPEPLLQKRVVVDVSSVPVIGFKTLKDGADKLVILPSKNMLGINQLQQLCSIPAKKIKVMSFEDICSESMLCDVLIAEPVERCGLLKKNIFEDVALIRTLCTVDQGVYPRQLVVFGTLIESSDLCARGKIVSDDNCLGHKISNFLNTYQTNIHQDLQLSTLRHTKLCDEIRFCNIDLENLSVERNKLQSFVEFHGTMEVVITKTGTVTAIPYWFHLIYGSDTVLNTLDCDSLWKQAAVIPSTPIEVSRGETVSVIWTCRNSCLHFSVEKSKTV